MAKIFTSILLLWLVLGSHAATISSQFQNSADGTDTITTWCAGLSSDDGLVGRDNARKTVLNTVGYTKDGRQVPVTIEYTYTDPIHTYTKYYLGDIPEICLQHTLPSCAPRVLPKETRTGLFQDVLDEFVNVLAQSGASSQGLVRDRPPPPQPPPATQRRLMTAALPTDEGEDIFDERQVADPTFVTASTAAQNNAKNVLAQADNTTKTAITNLQTFAVANNATLAMIQNTLQLLPLLNNSYNQLSYVFQVGCCFFNTG